MTASAPGRGLSAPPCESASTSDYGLISTDQQQAQITSARLDIRIGVPTHVEHGHVEGFIVSQHSHRRHLYDRFVDFPMWNRTSPQLNTKTSAAAEAEPSRYLLSSIDDEVWNDFIIAFSNDLKAGDRNALVFQFIAVSITLKLFLLQMDIGKMNPFLFGSIILVMFMILCECLRPSLFDRVDQTVAIFKGRFEEMDIRASMVYDYGVRGQLLSYSRYIVFTPLPHPKTVVNLV
jgi:hypothetical protein